MQSEVNCVYSFSAESDLQTLARALSSVWGAGTSPLVDFRVVTAPCIPTDQGSRALALTAAAAESAASARARGARFAARIATWRLSEVCSPMREQRRRSLRRKVPG